MVVTGIHFVDTKQDITRKGQNQIFFPYGATAPRWAKVSSIPRYSRSHSHTPQSVLFLWTSDQPDAEIKHNTHNRQTPMPPAGFEPAIPARERPQTHALDRAATGIGFKIRTIKSICISLYVIVDI